MIGRKTGIFGTLVLLVLALQAVSSTGAARNVAGSAGSVGPAAAPQTPLNLNIHLAGAGATFPAPLIFNWTDQYHALHPNVTISYGSVGSGRGQAAAINKTVDFGATDAPLSTRQRALYPGILHIPESIGSVVLSYNVTGTNGVQIGRGGMNLTGPVIANIFLGLITNWNDSAIRAINPGLARFNLLPNHQILTVHRSDGSGTTFVFTSYLWNASATWRSQIGNGTSVTWPVGVGASGNQLVANYIASTPNSIGYTELQYSVSSHLTYANVQNFAGNYIFPTLQSTFYAVANYTKTAVFPASNGDWSHVNILNEPGPQTYPIASFTYLLVYQEMNVVPSMDLYDKVQFQTLVDFLNWVITIGQNTAPYLNYVQLPASVVAIDQAGINLMKYTEISTPVIRNVSLSIGGTGFNGTQPGPSIKVATGDTVNLKLNNLDGIHHEWYIDFNNDTVQDSNETFITCTSTTAGIASCPQFSPTIWNTRSIPRAGTFTYRDNSTGATGLITVLPQQAAAVLDAPGTSGSAATDVNNKAFPTLDNSRVALIGSLLIDLRTDVASQNATIVAADKSTSAITYAHTYQVPNLQLGQVSGVAGLALRFVLNVAVGPYALSTNVLVQLRLVPVCIPTYSTFSHYPPALYCSQAVTSSSLTRELDMNGHGSVDITDVGTVLSAYGTTIGSPGYNPLADLNGSGTINILGLGPLFANYGYKVFYS